MKNLNDFENAVDDLDEKVTPWLDRNLKYVVAGVLVLCLGGMFALLLT